MINIIKNFGLFFCKVICVLGVIAVTGWTIMEVSGAKVRFGSASLEDTLTGGVSIGSGRLYVWDSARISGVDLEDGQVKAPNGIGFSDPNSTFIDDDGNDLRYIVPNNGKHYLMSGAKEIASYDSNRVTFNTPIELGGRLINLSSLSDSTKFDSVKYVSPKFTGNVNPYFSTITNALNSAGAGTLIIIMPGVYDEGNLTGKDSVHFELQNGVIWKYTANTANSIMSFGNIYSIISGKGIFIRSSTNSSETIFNASSSTSNIHIQALELRINQGVGITGNGRMVIKTSLLVNTGANLNDYCLTSNSNGRIFFHADSVCALGGKSIVNTGGFNHIEVKSIFGGIYNSGSEGSQYVYADFIKRGYGVISNGNGGKQYIYAQEIEATTPDGLSVTPIINSNQTGTEQYITAQKIYSDVPYYTVPMIVLHGFQVIKADYIYSYSTVINGQSAIYNNSFVEANRIECLNDTGHCVRIASAIMNVHIKAGQIIGGSQPSGQGSYSTINVSFGTLTLEVQDSIRAKRNGYSAIELSSGGRLYCQAGYITADSGYACILNGTGGSLIEAFEISNKSVNNIATVISINSASGTHTIRNSRIIGRGWYDSGTAETYVVAVITANSIFWNCIFNNTDLLASSGNIFYLPSGSTDIRLYGFNAGNVPIDNGSQLVIPLVGTYTEDASAQ